MTKKRNSDREEGSATDNSPEIEDSPRLFRRLIDSGLGVLLNTSEEGEKVTVKPFALPKELINYLIGQADRSKSEIISLFGREFKRFLEATDLSEEVVKALSQMTIEVKAEVNFKRSDKPGSKGSKIQIGSKKTGKSS